MWKLFIRIAGKPDMMQIAHAAEFSRTTRNLQDMYGFVLMSDVVSFLTSRQFTDRVGKEFGDDAEITEVQIKFEDIV